MSGASGADYDCLYRILLAGHPAVGKTALVIRFGNGTFQETYANIIGVEFMIKTIEVDGKRVKLQVWDAQSSGEFRKWGQRYYNMFHAFLFVYDTLQRIEDEVKTVREFRALDSFEKAVVANKIDLRDFKNGTNKAEGGEMASRNNAQKSMKKVTKEEGEALARGFNAHYFETSAKTGQGVDEAIIEMTKAMLRNAAIVPVLPPPPETKVAVNQSAWGCVLL